MTYRELIKENIRKGRKHIELAEKSTGLGKRVDERLHYRLACAYLIDAISAYNEVVELFGATDEDVQEFVVGNVDQKVSDYINNDMDVLPDAPDYN